MPTDIVNLHQQLQSENIKGLALDIDETLSWTLYHWISEMQKHFGNPENLTIKQLIAKYRYTQNVPYWQTEEALQWMESNRHSDELQERLPLIEGADQAVQRINHIIPIVAYITTRPNTVITGTKQWLDKHNFPEAPIITRPPYVEHNQGNI